MLISTLKPMQ